MIYSKKVKRKIHDSVLKVFTLTNIFTMMLIFASIDMIYSWIPYAVLVFNLIWLGLFGYANGWIYGTKKHEERMKKIYGKM